MSDTTPTDRFVFDAYAEQSAIVFSGAALPAGVIVVTDDALVNDVGGSSMPNADDHVTVAGAGKAMRGVMVQTAYVIRIE